LKWLDLGIRRDKRMRMRMRNVNITNKVKINVVVVGSDGFRNTMRECLNFTIIQVLNMNEGICQKKKKMNEGMN
jgi:hypothetical protein